MAKNSNYHHLKQAGKFLLEVVYNIAFIIALVVLIRSFIISPFSVHGSSMHPTLENGEFIIIDKLSKLQRGDVVVFLPPISNQEKYIEEVIVTDEKGQGIYAIDNISAIKNAPYCQKEGLQDFWFCQEKVGPDDWLYIIPKESKSLKESAQNMERRQITKEEIESGKIEVLGGENKEYVLRIYLSAKTEHYVKRIIGIEGDIVKIENGRVYLKKQGETEFIEIEEPYLSEENKNKTFFQNQPSSNEFEVPPGHYFVMGDNRTNSSDSRTWQVPGIKEPNPFVPKEQIAGKVGLVLMPFLDIRFITGADL